MVKTLIFVYVTDVVLVVEMTGWTVLVLKASDSDSLFSGDNFNIM